MPINLQAIYAKPTDEAGVSKYDATSHRWLLDISLVKKINPILDDETAQRKAEDYSSHVYDWFRYMLVHTANWDFVEFVLACTSDGKNAILNAMEAQAKADAVSNIDSLGDQSPIDVTSGAEINQYSLQSASIATYAKMILKNASIDLGGVQLLLCKSYPFGIYMPTDRYSVWGY